MASSNESDRPKVVTDRRARGGSPLTGHVLTVLLVSMALAVTAGAILLWYYR